MHQKTPKKRTFDPHAAKALTQKNMVFKRPGNSRDGQSGRSSSRNSQGGEQSKRSYSTPRGKSSDSGQNDNGPKRRFGNDRPTEKKSFSPRGDKPYAGKRNSGEQAGGSFSGERKSFAPKRPYTGRPTDGNGDAGNDRKSFAPKSKPYTGRPGADDRPAKSFGDRSFSGKPTGDDRAPKSFGRGGTKPGEKKFGRPTSGGDFKKREGDFGDRSNRKPAGSRDGSRSNHNPATRDIPAKTLRAKKTTEPKDKGLVRLNRYIANAGICSRRKADELILAGVVTVNGEVMAELGSKVDPSKDEIRYNGELLKREKMIYVLLNKPKDYITTTEDPQERRTVMHLVEKASRERIYPIGRLDRNTTGLLLMTNDGELADKLSHPRSNVTKLYQVELSKSLTQGDLNKLQFGVELEDGIIKPDAVSYVAGGSKREIGVQIHSGKNRIVRRMFEHLGYEVVKLDRVVYANLTKKDLPRGRWRYLEEQEIIQLKHLIKA